MKDNKEIDPLWHLAEAVSIQEAASLIAGYDPHELALAIGDSDVHEGYPRYYPAIRALRQAVATKSLNADAKWVQEYDEMGNYEYNSDVLIATETIVAIEDLKKWLSERGFRGGFLFPSSMPDYLDPANEHYSQKLAAAISVWEAVTSDPALMRGTTAKQAMMKWLRRNADKYGLTKDDGNPNEQGIEEVAKIANWDAKGGAPKTPS